MKILKGLFALLAIVLVTLTSYVYRLTGYPAEIKPIEQNKPAQFTDWKAALSGAAMVDYKLLQVGRIVMDRNLLMQGAPDSYPQRYTALPVLSHWIRHPVYGEYLVDAGFSKSFKNNSGGNYNWLMRTIASLSGIENSLEKSLELQLNHKVGRINGVMVTHFHPDHSSGISDLPTGTSVIADEKEYDFIARLSNTALFTEDYDWHGIDFTKGSKIAPFTSVVDVFGDGAVWAVSTPGHTKGHTSYLLNTTQGIKFVVGDASHFGYAYDNNYAPAALSGELRQQAAETLASIKTFASQHPDIKLIFGHQLP
ncbi:MBL fold metallo-hydrolase [Vibrio sp. SCSIO 43140]|uniref:MBL fold metallo-hydrolase n=1 Tax=Vibrio sp. SCSIO 43140 TaxID=2819100 RepID=UPI00207508BD|nr:MBL fold metallo-hydrolase [Vibrio sp. SCSIO 43140]USD61634.1 MBL fold metallo-hydrolase [Vibrio sp. SCSIO 43140]